MDFVYLLVTSYTESRSHTCTNVSKAKRKAAKGELKATWGKNTQTAK